MDKIRKITPKSFYMVRHGETIYNAHGIVGGGDTNPPLTEKGLQQSRELRKLLNHLRPKPEKIIVSGLKRTHETAEAIFGHRNFEIEPEMDEHRFGFLDGKLPLKQQRAIAKHKDIGLLPGEESYEEHRSRMAEALNRQLEKTDATPFFVSHSGSIRRVMEMAGVKDRIDVKNAQAYHFVPVGRGWKIYELSMKNNKLCKKEVPFSSKEAEIGATERG